VAAIAGLSGTRLEISLPHTRALDEVHAELVEAEGIRWRHALSSSEMDVVIADALSFGTAGLAVRIAATSRSSVSWSEHGM
jgi:hypothetical protein